MNLPITPAAEELYNKTAKQNKKVSAEKLPWVLFLEIVGESIDAPYAWPAAGEDVEINSENWVVNVWEKVVEKLTSEYAKKPCFVVVEIAYTNSEGNEMSVPTFFKWCPESGVPVKAKMMIGSSFQSIKRKLDVQGTTPEIGLASELQINKFAELAKLKGWVNK
eukprot:UN01699